MINNLNKEFNWVRKVLLSSTNINHIVVSIKLFNNFLNKWRFDIDEGIKTTFLDDFYEDYWVIKRKIEKNDVIM
jgi:hypothetical protein